jgi:hypothetical protein
MEAFAVRLYKVQLLGTIPDMDQSGEKSMLDPPRGSNTEWALLGDIGYPALVHVEVSIRAAAPRGVRRPSHAVPWHRAGAPDKPRRECLPAEVLAGEAAHPRGRRAQCRGGAPPSFGGCIRQWVLSSHG